MRDLSLKLLGRPVLRRGGVEVAFPTKKALALLAYLVVERGLQTREKLAALLWPDSDETHARGALRYTLTNLKSRLGNAGLVVQRDAVGFEAPARLEIDVETTLEAAYEAVVRSAASDVPIAVLRECDNVIRIFPNPLRTRQRRGRGYTKHWLVSWAASRSARR